jgi:hypothetical protein
VNLGSVVRRDLSPRATALVLASLAVMSAVLVLAATRHGLGVTPDSVSYASAARNIVAGRSLVDFTGQHLGYWPPGLPLVLALGVQLGLTVERAARVVNAAAATAIVLLTYLLARSVVPTRRSALVAAAIVAMAPAMLRIEDSLWSEPLFTVFVLAFVVVIGTPPVRMSTGRVLAAGALAGLATTLRFHGAALVVAGVALMFLAADLPVRRRVVGATLLVLCAAAVCLPWVVWNLSEIGSVRSSVSAPGAGPLRALGDLARALGRFVVPDQFGDGLTLAACVVVLVVLTGAVVWLRPRRSELQPLLGTTLTAAILVGSAFLAAASGSSDVNARILAPVFPLVAVIVVWLVRAVLEKLARQDQRASARGVGVLAALACVVIGAWGLLLVHDHGSAGRGYAASGVEHSPLVALAAAVPGAGALVTNDPLPVAYWTGRTPVFVVGDGSTNEAGQKTVTARRVRDLACIGSAFYLRSTPTDAAAKAFEHDAQRSLGFETVQRSGDVSLMKIVPADPAACD